MSVETITVTITRDQLGAANRYKNTGFNLFLSGLGIVKTLREKRIPVVGIDGAICVARGKLTIEHEDGLDGDEWTYTFVGEPIMKEALADVCKRGLSLTGPTLAEVEAAMRAKLDDDDEL